MNTHAGRKANHLVSIALLFAVNTPVGSAGDVLLINQAKARADNVTPRDGALFPMTLNAQGSYRLSSSLTLPADPDKPAAGAGWWRVYGDRLRLMLSSSPRLSRDPVSGL